MNVGFRCDVDGTIADPLFCAGEDFWETARQYIAAGVVTEGEVHSLNTGNRQRLWLLPQVLLTHVALPGAVEGLQHLAQFGTSLEYFTVRQAINAESCKRVHENTRVWLETLHFPAPRETRFFWNPEDKLLVSLEALEPYIALIDDRPAGLIEAHQRIAAQDVQRAEEIRQRVVLVAFGYADTQQLLSFPDTPQIVPLADWSRLRELLSSLEEKFIERPIVPSVVPKEGTYGNRRTSN